MPSTYRRRGALALMPSLALALAAPAIATADAERVSVGLLGAQANGASGAAAASADGRFVAFVSEASNLVADDGDATADVFVRDRRTGATTRVSIGPDGEEADGFSAAPAMSGDGRIVAFASRAENLVEDDPNGGEIDVFVNDRATGTTVRLPVPGRLAAGEAWASYDPAVSRDGRYVAFAAVRVAYSADEDHEVGPAGVYVHDLTTRRTRRVSVSSRDAAANGESGEPAISAHGRYVAFHSGANNLVRRDSNGKPDVFLRDRRRGTTVRVSVGARGAQARDASSEPAISAGGRYVAFSSRAALGHGDKDRATDVYVHDRRTGRTARVSAGLSGWATAPAISGTGRLVAFQLSPTDLIGDGSGPVGTVYVRDRAAATTRPAVGESDRRSGQPSLSADGRTLAFVSATTDLVAGDTNGVADVFVVR